MSKILKQAQRAGGEALREFIVAIVGWFYGMLMLAGAYSLGRWLAPHIGFDAGRDMFGLLSALAFLWHYEHRNAEEKYNRVCTIVARQEDLISS